VFDPRTAEVARLAAAEVAARAEIKRLSAALKDRRNPNDPATHAWTDATARWRLILDRLYPAAFWPDVAALKQARRRDEATNGWVWSSAPPESVEMAIRFLEADLGCFRSGYVKERLIRHLVRQDLGGEALRRLRRVVLSALDRPARREFGAICRLAIRVSDDAPRAEVASFARNDNPEIARRAAWMRDVILEGRVGLQARQRPPSRR
jgi:hypothetical protein